MSKSNKSLKTKLDTLFSQYIRRKYADRRGFVYCYTCGTAKPIAEMQNGHFHSRRHLSTRYEEKNCRPQCYGCNVINGGKKDVFRTRLEAEIGERGMKELNKLKEKLIKDFPYDDFITLYTQKLKQLDTPVQTFSDHV